MDRTQTAKTLTVAMQLDSYGLSITPDMIEAWAMALSDVDFGYAQRAIMEHYRDQTRRVAVADIVRLSKEIEQRDRDALAAERRDRKLQAELAAPREDGFVPVSSERLREILAPYEGKWSKTGDPNMRRQQDARWGGNFAAVIEEIRRRGEQSASPEEDLDDSNGGHSANR